MNVMRPGLESLNMLFQRLIARWLVQSEVHPSLKMTAGSSIFIPDCVHVITARRNPIVEKISSIYEVAFSQLEAGLLEKLRKVVKAYPELDMIIMVVIKESSVYRSPSPLSTTSLELGPENNSLSKIEFISLRDGESTLDVPSAVEVGGHCWCAISSVQVRVWVRGQESINIDTKDQSMTACGVRLV
jgi:hypothetical protein